MLSLVISEMMVREKGADGFATLGFEGFLIPYEEINTHERQSAR